MAMREGLDFPGYPYRLVRGRRLAGALIVLVAGTAASCGGSGSVGGVDGASLTRYEVTAVSPSDRAAAHSVNDDGLVVGSFSGGGAFRWQSGRTEQLPGREAWCVNNSGQVAGEAGGTAHLWDREGESRALPYKSIARGINDAGQVVGEVVVDGRTMAFLWEGDRLHLLDGLGGDWSVAYGINGAGHVVGWAETKSDDPVEARRLVAFRWEAGVMTALGTLGGRTSVAYAINDSGQAVGYSSTASGDDRAFLVDESGALLDLGTLGGYSVAFDVDNLGRVVGESLTAGKRVHAVLWEAGRIIDLNDFLPAGSDWELSRASSINDEGQIAGEGFFRGEPRAFLLTPVP